MQSSSNSKQGNLLEERGGSAEGFVARQVSDPMVRDADLVLTATRDVRARVLEDVPSAVRRTFTLLELADLAPSVQAATPAGLVLACAAERASRHEGAGTDAHELPDPIGGDAALFAHVADLVDEATATIALALSAVIRPTIPMNRTNLP